MGQRNERIYNFSRVYYIEFVSLLLLCSAEALLSIVSSINALLIDFRQLESFIVDCDCFSIICTLSLHVFVRH